MRVSGRMLSFIAALQLLVLVGCGHAPTTVKEASQLRTTPTPAPSATAAPATQSGLDANTFIVWIKRNFPQTAARIIDDYLSNKVMGTYDPAVEQQRDQLRRQAIDTCTNELYKNVSKGLPPGLQARVVGSRVKIIGTTIQQGQEVNVAFDFDVSIDSMGIMWIRQPADSILVTSSSLLVKLFGGNLHEKARAEIIKQLDEQGPPNCAMVQGLSYYRGGTFRLDPGVAYLAMQK